MENKFEEDYLERYVKKTGLVREKVIKSDKKISLDKIRIIVNFGDFPSSITFGSIVCPRFCDSSFYNIVLTWKGMSFLYPHADEVWCLDRGYALGDFYSKSNGIKNNSQNLVTILRSLNEHFVGVVDFSSYSKYYHYTLTTDFYKEFPVFNQSMPSLMPFVYMPNDFKNNFSKKEKNCALMPVKYSRYISDGSTNLTSIDQDYYSELLKNLVSAGYKVFCIQNSVTYDMSGEVPSESIVYLKEDDVGKICSMLNHIGLYFDFFSDTGSLALLSGASLFRVTDRSFYFTSKKYVEDNILSFSSSVKNMFSFLYFCRKDSELNNKFFEHIILQLDQFYENLSQKTEDKTVLREKEIKMLDLSRFYVKKLFPKFISISKGSNHG